MTEIVGFVCAMAATPSAMPSTMPAATTSFFMIISDIEAQPAPSMDVQSPVGGCIGTLNFEGSIRTVTSDAVLLDARCRVTNARNLHQGDEGPNTGDTAGVPLYTKSRRRGE